MAELKTYAGRPIKRMRRTESGSIHIVFFAPDPGEDGDQITVSQADWDANGKRQHFSKERMPDVRQLARQYYNS